MSTPRGAWPLIVAALIGAGLFLVPTASAGIKAPGALVPGALVKVDRMPVFTWAPVKGADHYEFQMAADKGFNSTVASGKVATKNTAVTLPTSLINGTYYWRVRSISPANKPSGWTKTRAPSRSSGRRSSTSRHRSTVRRSSRRRHSPPTR